MRSKFHSITLMRCSYLYIIQALLITAFLFHTEELVAQSEDPFRIAVSDGNVYLYLLESPRTDFAYNFYRKDPGDSDFKQINEDPVRGVAYGDQLKVVLGNQYDQIRRLAEVTSEGAMLNLARGNSTEAIWLSMTYPELAQAVNKLYIDETAPEGEQVEYLIEFLNQRDEPTGESYQKQVVVEDHVLGNTEILNVTNEGKSVTVEWDYTPVMDDDVAFRFNVFTNQPSEDNYQRVNRGIILRNLQQDTFSYTFNTESIESEIEIRVGSVSITSAPGPLSESVTYLVQDNVAPSVVQGVRTSLMQDSVQVQWRVSRELDAAGYYVYRGTESDGEFERLNQELIPINQPFYFDRNLTQGSLYLYRITAVDESGNESEFSTAVTRIVPDNTAPSAPLNLTADLNNDGNQILLNWSTSELPDDFRNFVVFRRVVEGRSPSSNYSQIAPPNLRENSFTDTGSDYEEGALYRFGVLAADSSRNFSDTTFVDVRIPNVTPPDPPNVVSAQNRDGVRVNIVWGGSLSRDVGSYNLYRKIDNREYELTEELESDLRSFRDEEIEIGKTYTYAISAVDTSGNESDLIESESVLVKRSNPPRRVRNVRAVQTSDGVQVRWEPVASEHLAGYKVYVADRSTGNFEPIHENLISETSLTADTGTESIWFRVTALDITGNESRPSEPVRLIVP
ncbi:fibronectin type III domain-containing protein [Rhodohalobacter barkolensis]|uniref:fibronectin type III domain-containing protein n=1 Tax=Rhodohalobacter barkolensis TaxID=2053187 RepID=UPI00105441C6|nr:hypothetical protein [Rhodohalobacter barkolensis]